jgi:hypothetical protein
MQQTKEQASLFLHLYYETAHRGETKRQAVADACLKYRKLELEAA